MARPRGSYANREQYEYAYRLHATEKTSAGAISRRLKEEFHDPVSLRTVERWVKTFEPSSLDEVFQWANIPNYDLPWEASQYLLESWADVVEFQGTVSRVLGRPSAAPTGREMIWCWRLHGAVPEIGNPVDIYLWAVEFARRELLRDLLAIPLDLGDLQAYLAYRPWQGPEQLRAYQSAVTEQRIPALRVWREALDVERARPKTRQADLIRHSSLSSEHPEVLPSKVVLRSLEMMRPLLAKRRGLEAELEALEAKQMEVDNERVPDATK